eukprot:2721683-Rhodomonas_salina.1
MQPYTATVCCYRLSRSALALAATHLSHCPSLCCYCVLWLSQHPSLHPSPTKPLQLLGHEHKQLQQ